MSTTGEEVTSLWRAASLGRKGSGYGATSSRWVNSRSDFLHGSPTKSQVVEKRMLIDQNIMVPSRRSSPPEITMMRDGRTPLIVREPGIVEKHQEGALLGVPNKLVETDTAAATARNGFEMPKVSIFEKVVEIPEKIGETKITIAPRIHLQEQITQVPRIVPVEKIVQVTDVEYHEVPCEKIIEVPQYRDEVFICEVPIDEYVEVPVQQDKLVEVAITFDRKIPKPVELVSEWRFRMPQMKVNRQTEDLPIFIPRFIEVPVPTAFLPEQELTQANKVLEVLHNVRSNWSSPTSPELESLAQMAKSSEYLIQANTSSVGRAHFESILRTQLLNLAGTNHS